MQVAGALAPQRTADDVVEIRTTGVDDPGIRAAAARCARNGATRQVVWTVPLRVPRPGAENDPGDREVWRAFASVASSSGHAVVRLEMPNGADPAASVAAFRSAATVLRHSGVLVEWGLGQGVPVEQAAALWPGDDVVDLVGAQVDTTRGWVGIVADPGGLADWDNLARTHARRLAVHWQVAPPTPATTVRAMRSWLDVATPVLAYETAALDPHADSRALASYRALWAD